MQEAAYTAWLAARGYEAPTQSTSLSALRRIEAAYGPLDKAFLDDGLEGILSELVYSKSDERANQPNPSRIQMTGNIYNSLSSLRTHLNFYRRFLEAGDPAPVHVVEPAELPAAGEDNLRTFSMERDLQTALRASISQLEPGLTVIDGGAERGVPSGRIDILARDAAGAFVVIELKAVKAQRDAVAQVLAYMGDLHDEAQGRIRGILVAPDFDAKATAAARVVPGLKLIRYSFSFTFADNV